MKTFFLILSVISIIALALVLTCSAVKAGFCSALNQYYTYIGTAAIQVGLFSIAMFFLWKNNLRETVSSIGFPGKLSRTAIFTAIGLCAIFSVLLIVGIAAIVGGFNDQSKIRQKVGTLPPLVLALAVVLAPISEELFFRAFLSPRVGIIISSIFFAVVHFTYGSVIEVVGVLFVGLLLGALFRMSKSITPCIMTHMVYNFLSISVMLLLGGKA